MTRNPESPFVFWSSYQQEQALREGWCLSVVNDDAIQVQKIDDVEEVSKSVGFPVPELGTDNDAMLKIFFGTAEHHFAAKQVLKETAPEEWALMLSTAAKTSLTSSVQF